LVLVPGLAFDREGFRLGRGAGWYDRTFSAWAPLPSRFGLCFSFQRSDALLPSEPHDVPMTDIVCDDGQLRA
jgi:5-formyltetrahydrofolate cyclo-ligase